MPLTAGAPPEQVAYVTHNRDDTFELHVQRSGVVAFAASDSSSWQPLDANAQRMLHSGALLEIGGARHRVQGCRPRAAKRRREPEAAAAAAPERQGFADAYVAGALHVASVEKQLLYGLQGAELRTATRNLATVRDAAAAVALAPADPRAVQRAAGSIKKLVNDHDKRQRRDEKSHEHAVDRAVRLERSQQRLRAEGTSKRERKTAEGAVAAAERAATRTADRRTFTNRTKLRKAKRALQAPRGGRGGPRGGGGTSSGRTQPPGRGGGCRGSFDGGHSGGRGGGRSGGRGGGRGAARGSGSFGHGRVVSVVPGSRFVRGD